MNEKKFKKNSDFSTSRLYKRNLYLNIFSELKDGLRPIQISGKYELAGNTLQYHLNKLKKANIIRKIGYGTWELCADYSLKEVQNLVENLTPNTSKDLKTFFEKGNNGVKKFKKHLLDNDLLKCVFCGRSDVLIHHLRPRMLKGDDSFDNLLPVCEFHHKLIHANGVSSLMADKIAIFKDVVSSINIKNKIRGHAFIMTVKVPRIDNWSKRDVFLNKKGIKFISANKGQRILIDDFKVWLYHKKVVIFFPKGSSILDSSARMSKAKALEDAFEVIYKLEKLFSFSFKINKKYHVKVVKQHYAELKNELANDYNSKKKKLYIADENGFWLLIDDSHDMKLDEMETIDPDRADEDMDIAVKPFFNSLRKKPFTAYDFESLFDTVEKLASASKLANDQMLFLAENNKSHFEVLNGIKDAINELRKQMKK